MNGLHMINFDKNKIVVDSDVTEEMRRLRLDRAPPPLVAPTKQPHHKTPYTAAHIEKLRLV